MPEAARVNPLSSVYSFTCWDKHAFGFSEINSELQAWITVTSLQVGERRSIDDIGVVL